jgi:hypothetical protein
MVCAIRHQAIQSHTAVTFMCKTLGDVNAVLYCVLESPTTLLHCKKGNFNMAVFFFNMALFTQNAHFIEGDHHTSRHVLESTVSTYSHRSELQ